MHPGKVRTLQVRKLFLEPEVLPATEVNLKWNDPDEEGLVEFLVKQKVRGALSHYDSVLRTAIRIISSQRSVYAVSNTLLLQGFNADRVSSGIAKLKKARGSGQQMRMDSFFKSVPSTAPPAAAGVKRKAEEAAKAKASAKKGKK